MKQRVAQIAYGRSSIPLQLDPGLAAWSVFVPRHEKAHLNPQGGFAEACRAPVACPPLQDIVQPSDRVVIATSDGTRPVPNHLLVPWLLEALPVPPENVTVLVGTGTHRPNTTDELARMFGEDVMRSVRLVNHDAYEGSENERVGTVDSGVKVSFNKEYVNADKRILVGFIEPHFFAGFSGGPKAVAPGIASLDTILHLHRYDLVAHADSTWGILDGNPLQETIRAMVGLCPADFLVNVALNSNKEVTAFFLGDSLEAHRLGCDYVREHAMVPVPHEFPVVVTSNSGYPLDQNLYQSVKGMSAAARIVSQGGSVFMASECSDGIPEHGNFGSMLRDSGSIEELDAHLRGLSTPSLDQWQAQVLAQIRQRCDVILHSKLDESAVAACKLTAAPDLEGALRHHLASLGRRVPVAVLPEGPVTVPYVT